jgi:SAM-dependent methyltransferase
MNNYSAGTDGIRRPEKTVNHRDDEYDQAEFATLLAMQDRHFWYRGRHRFLVKALDRFARKTSGRHSAIDLGGGVGGWVRDLSNTRPHLFDRLALADSSVLALEQAKAVLPNTVERYHIDLMDLQMSKDWDIAFLLDVIEHLPHDIQAVVQAKESLKPGGLLFITTPALAQFWSYNDEVAQHLRRYNRSDFADLARKAGLDLVDCRYFMFFLSPLYLLSRLRPGIKTLSDEHKQNLFRQQHAVPSEPLNAALSLVFNLETPLGHWIHFPWGTSILGVFRRKQD